MVQRELGKTDELHGIGASFSIENRTKRYRGSKTPRGTTSLTLEIWLRCHFHNHGDFSADVELEGVQQPGRLLRCGHSSKHDCGTASGFNRSSKLAKSEESLGRLGNYFRKVAERLVKDVLPVLLDCIGEQH
jgi:hypothetical protein